MKEIKRVPVFLKHSVVKGSGLALIMCIISILSMGCTRNLQLGSKVGSRARAHFFVWAQCRPFTQLLSGSKKRCSMKATICNC